MIYKLILCTVLGQLSNILKKENGQRKKAGKASLIWPGWGEFLRLNGIAILFWFVATASVYAALWNLLSHESIDNYNEPWTFWLFVIKKGIIYDVIFSLAAWGVGYMGSDAIIEWLGKSNRIINNEIDKKTPPAHEATPMPTELPRKPV